jgi:hypothetical protein
VGSGSIAAGHGTKRMGTEKLVTLHEKRREAEEYSKV